jgi:branched-chain amino acid transport system ATP-binding protein
MPRLVLERVSVDYGVIPALRDVSLRVEHGRIASLIGANGAGKTTLLRAISGLVRVAGGSIRVEDTDSVELTRLAVHRIVQHGVVHVPEGRQVFANHTVRENLLLGASQQRDRAIERQILRQVHELFPVLEQRHNQKAGTLSGGEQQMLAIGRALLARPRILLLDEPSLGLAPLIVRRIFQTIRRINEMGATILLVEQNAHMALAVAHEALVLQNGQVIASGPAAEMLNDPLVKAAYLGG